MLRVTGYIRTKRALIGLHEGLRCVCECCIMSTSRKFKGRDTNCEGSWIQINTANMDMLQRCESISNRAPSIQAVDVPDNWVCICGITPVCVENVGFNIRRPRRYHPGMLGDSTALRRGVSLGRGLANDWLLATHSGVVEECGTCEDAGGDTTSGDTVPAGSRKTRGPESGAVTP